MPLPSLPALYAFEAVARCVSISGAATELCVTPGAVSRHVKLLEDFYGYPLLERVGRGIALSPRGAKLAAELRLGFEHIRQAHADSQHAGARQVIKLRSYTTFATHWLLTHIASFQIANPDIEVRLSMASSWSDPHEFDVAIRLGNGGWEGLEDHALVPNLLSPACAPEIAARLRTPEDLRHLPLLFSPHRPDDWRLWLANANGPDVASLEFIEFESSSVAYQAAIVGRGVAIGQQVLIKDYLSSGRLVCPLPQIFDHGAHTYRLVWAKSHRDTRAIQRLSDALTMLTSLPED